MCGILGWIGNHTEKNVARFTESLDLMAHRGPDDKGVWIEPEILLGHRRLSIVDLSMAGHQPMRDPISGCVIVFNGEIYNHLEIAKELRELGHDLISHSDTEVLLHALIEWGPKALTRLNGMWSFAFWSPQSKELMLARDRFGVKPLYYCSDLSGIAFASEPKSLLSLFPKHRAVNENTLLNFLCNNLLYSDNSSFYEGISILPPAHFAIFHTSNKKLELKRYWDYPQQTNENLTNDEALEEFSVLFEDSVRLRMRSDVAVGLTLSGGLDSTAILAAASTDTKSPIICFTSVYSGGLKGESNWAKLACKNANATLVKVDAPQEEWLPTLQKIAWHMDAPGYSPAVYPLWNLMKKARDKQIPVLLEGQGADEALAGYTQYAVLDLLVYLKGFQRGQRSVAGVVNRLSGLNRTFGLQSTLGWILRELSSTLLDYHRNRAGLNSLIHPSFSIPARQNVMNHGNDRVRNRLLDDHAFNILPGLLHYGDAISMAHSIEARNPFLDYRLVEWMFKLPAHLRFNNCETKWVLREYLRRKGQVEIGNRPDKKGYPTPVGYWLASKHGADLEDLLLNKDSHILHWCNREKISKLIERHRSGARNAEFHLYKLLSTQIWLKECIG